VTDVFGIFDVAQQVPARRQIHYFSPFMLPMCLANAKLSQSLSGTVPENETAIALAATIINGQKKTSRGARNLCRFKTHRRKGDALRFQYALWLDRRDFRNPLCQRSADQMRRGHGRCSDEHDQ
jgi:hypothetical protein